MDRQLPMAGALKSILKRFINKLAGADRSSPLVIEKQGYFFVGGKYFTTSGGQFMAGQMYVEYQIPRQPKHRYPIVMWHGGGQSGACYTGTPDGREDWAQPRCRRSIARPDRSVDYPDTLGVWRLRLADR